MSTSTSTSRPRSGVRRPPGSRRGPLGVLAAAVAGYLAGSFPSADLAGRFAARRTGAPADLRQVGSGNPGAANAATVLGPRWGAAVLAMDGAKGAAATGLGRRLGGPGGGDVAGVAAVVGHCWPPWSGFRGGKGVATAAGVCAATEPRLVAGIAAASALGAGSGLLAGRTGPAAVLAGLIWTAAVARRARRIPVGPAVITAVVALRFITGRRPPAPG